MQMKSKLSSLVSKDRMVDGESGDCDQSNSSAEENTVDSNDSPASQKDPFTIPCHVIGRNDMQVSHKLSIYALTSEDQSADNLGKNGYLGLVFLEGRDLFRSNRRKIEEKKDHHYYVGMFSDWWVPMVKTGSCTSNTVTSHDGSNHDAPFLTLHDYFPTDSALSCLMCVVTKFLCLKSDTELVAGTPQYLLTSTNGFSTRYWRDSPSCLYRVFVYMGREFDPSPEAGYETNSDEMDYAFVTYGRKGAMKVVDAGKEYDVMTLLGLYQEADFKFALFPGDMLIIDGGSPWAVDLPFAIWSPYSRMLSWPIYASPNRSTPIGKSFPIVSPKLPTLVPYYDEFLNNPEVKRRYDKDLIEVMNCGGRFPVSGDGKTFNDSVQILSHMEKARVFPFLYTATDIQKKFKERLQKGDLLDVSSLF